MWGHFERPRRSPVETLETARLWLRRISIDDLPALAELYRDPEVMRHLGARARELEESRQFVQRMVDHWAQCGFGFFTVFERDRREQGPVLGRVGLGFLEDTGQVELGYLFGRASWGRGYATECATELLRWGFEQLGLSRIVAIAVPENLGSIRVMQKAGLAADGMSHHYGFQVVRYGLRVEAWRQARR